MNRLLLSLILIFSITATSGCATIFKGSNAEIRVTSTPDNAKILINGINRGSTPTTLNLNRDDNYVLTFQKEGYEDLNVEVRKEFDAATTIVGNLFSWWVVGLVVDFASGAAYSLSPADLNSNLSELRAAGIIETDGSTENGLHVFLLTQEEWEEIQSAE